MAAKTADRLKPHKKTGNHATVYIYFSLFPPAEEEKWKVRHAVSPGISMTAHDCLLEPESSPRVNWKI